MMDWRKIPLSFWAWVNRPRVLKSRFAPIEEFFTPEQLAEHRAKFEGDVREIVQEEMEAAGVLRMKTRTPEEEKAFSDEMHREFAEALMELQRRGTLDLGLVPHGSQ